MGTVSNSLGAKTVRKCLELHVVLTVRLAFYTKNW